MKVGFIGCGNMGGALASAAAKSVGEDNVYLSDLAKTKADSLSLNIGAQKSSNEEIAEKCEYIFLGVKPQVLEKTVSEIAPVLKARKDSFILVSMAAGISRDAILKMLGFECSLIRIMPNTPCAVGDGIILYCAPESFSKAQKEEFENIFSHAGIVDEITENLIDAASAVSGCGPAFAYLFIEALSDGAVLCGLPRDKALLYAAQTLSGAAQTVIKTSSHPAVLKDAVCSPGGTTVEGVRALEEGAFRASAMNAVICAYQKTLDMQK